MSLLAKGLLAVVLSEALASLLLVRLPLPGQATLGILRLVQTGLLLLLVAWAGNSWAVIGLDRNAQADGLRWGLGGAALFALVALAGAVALHLAGINPLAVIRTPLPPSGGEKLLFFVVGGCIAPIAEELLFRGYLYTYCRRWGILAALALSTAVFVALHLPSGLPLTQIVGGVVFALAYEYSGSLIAPILIHSLGNLAIFGLALI